MGGRWTGKVWLELTAGLYFPEPYSLRLHMSVLRGIRELVEDSTLTVCPTDLPTSEVTKAKVDDTDIRGHPLVFETPQLHLVPKTRQPRETSPTHG